MWIEPRGFEEIHSRGNVEQHRLQDPSKWVPYGVGAIEGQTARSLPVLDAGGSNGSDSAGAQVFGPGEEPRPREGEPTASAHGELL
jgi:hypothetical protein